MDHVIKSPREGLDIKSLVSRGLHDNYDVEHLITLFMSYAIRASGRLQSRSSLDVHSPSFGIVMGDVTHEQPFMCKGRYLNDQVPPTSLFNSPKCQMTSLGSRQNGIDNMVVIIC